MKAWAFLLLLNAGAALAATESLSTLYRDARNNHPGYLAVQAEAAAEAEREPIARGRLLPNLSFGGNYGRGEARRSIPNASEDRFSYDSYAYSLSLRQSLFRMQDLAEYRKARVLGASAAEIQGRGENQLLLGMVGVFLELQLIEDRLRLQSAQQAAAASQLAAAKRGFALGAGTRIDIDEVSARVDLLAAQTLELEGRRTLLRQELEDYVGRPLGELPRFDPSEFSRERFQPPGDVEEWIAAALAANHDYRLLAAQAEAAQQDVAVARAGHYPTVDLVASAGRSANDSLSTLSKAGDVRYETNNLGLQFSVPLFAGGQVSAQLRQAQARASQLRFRLEEFRARLVREMRNEYDNVARGWDKLRALELAERSAQQGVFAIGKGISAGVRSTTDLLLAEQQHVGAQVELARGRYQVFGALLKLKSMAGKLHDKELERFDICFH